MTVGVKVFSNDGRVQINATGGETTLAFDFPIFEESHIRIIRTRAGVDTTLTLTTDYTVPLASIADEDGGQINLVSPALNGDRYTLLLDVPYERVTDFNPSGDFLSETLNLQLDLLTQQNQQIVRDVGRAAKLPESSTVANLQFPAPAANQLLGWNATADGLKNFIAADLGEATIITPYAETLLQADNASEAGIAPYTAPTTTVGASIALAEGTTNGTNTASIKAADSLGSDITATVRTGGDIVTVTTGVITSSNLSGMLTDETGTGSAVFAAAPLMSSITLAAGTATAGTAPLYLTSGTNLTTATAGATEYDGKVEYFTPQGTQRGVVPASQFFALDSALAGANGTSAQNILGVGCTVSASTYYEFEGVFNFSKAAGTTSHTFGLLFGGTATLNKIGYQITGDSSTVSFTSGFGTRFGVAPQVATAITAYSGLTSAAQFLIFYVRGIVSINAGGTFTPQYILGTAPGGAYSTAAGSFFRIAPIGASGANVSVGTWA
jgi:hypothetical protein